VAVCVCVCVVVVFIIIAGAWVCVGQHGTGSTHHRLGRHSSSALQMLTCSTCMVWPCMLMAGYAQHCTWGIDAPVVQCEQLPACEGFVLTQLLCCVRCCCAAGLIKAKPSNAQPFFPFEVGGDTLFSVAACAA
jgi:hypothetical protein